MTNTNSSPLRIAVIGSALGGGAAQVIDAISRSAAQVATAIYDNSPEAIGKYINGIQVVGSSNNVIEAYKEGAFDAAIIAIGNIKLRKDVFDWLTHASIPLCNVIDKDAVVSTTALIGIGNVFLCHTYIGPGVIIRNNCYIITGSRINHDSSLGSHCYLSTGVSIAGRVKIGDMVKFDTSSGSAPDCLIPAGTYLQPGQIATSKLFPRQK
jgi:NDP-sugar pyrophosphorylase family protein